MRRTGHRHRFESGAESSRMHRRLRLVFSKPAKSYPKALLRESVSWSAWPDPAWEESKGLDQLRARWVDVVPSEKRAQALSRDLSGFRNGVQHLLALHSRSRETHDTSEPSQWTTRPLLESWNSDHLAIFFFGIRNRHRPKINRRRRPPVRDPTDGEESGLRSGRPPLRQHPEHVRQPASGCGQCS